MSLNIAQISLVLNLLFLVDVTHIRRFMALKLTDIRHPVHQRKLTVVANISRC